eukprot:1184955-Amphidinium_carterae.2
MGILDRHAAYLAARFLVKPTEVTPFRAVFGENFGEQCAEFRETVMARQPVSPSGKIHCNRRYNKAGTLWLKGVWLGRTEQTAEHIVAAVDESLPEGEQAGVITVCAIRSLEKEKQANAVLLERMQGAPWQAFGLARGVSKRSYDDDLVVASRDKERRYECPWIKKKKKEGEQGETVGDALTNAPSTPMPETSMEVEVPRGIKREASTQLEPPEEAAGDVGFGVDVDAILTERTSQTERQLKKTSRQRIVLNLRSSWSGMPSNWCRGPL